MSLETDAMSVLISQIVVIVKKIIDKASFTKEYIGVVEKSLGLKKYYIRYNDTSYEMTMQSNIPLSIYQKVHVVLPNNKIENRYVLEDVIYKIKES